MLLRPYLLVLSMALSVPAIGSTDDELMAWMSVQSQAPCTYIAKQASHGALRRIMLAENTSHLPAVPLPDSIADRSITFGGLLDINNDGERDYVYLLRNPGPLDSRSVVAFDREMTPISLSYRADPPEAFGGDRVNTYGLLVYRKVVYLLGLDRDEPVILLKTDRTNSTLPMCLFERSVAGQTAGYRALAQYEWLRLIMGNGASELWELALSQKSFKMAEELLKQGYRVDDRIREQVLLTWAIENDFAAAAEWLIRHGANPSPATGDVPLKEALFRQQFALAASLMRHGADPEPYLNYITPPIETAPAEVRALMLAVISRLHYLPEDLLDRALLTDDPDLVDLLLKTRAPVRSSGTYWYTGEPDTATPRRLRRIARENGGARLEAKLGRFYQRPPLPPANNFGYVSYGVDAEGLLILRHPGSSISDTDLLLFSTALCDTFTSHACGPAAQVEHARAWASSLTGECPDKLRPVLDDAACHIAVRYRDLAKDSLAAFPTATPYARALTWTQMMEMYQAKRGR